ncbi:MAG: hypothetical protein ACXW5U_11985 [Thermoanaerobaculia bacterium]
MVVENLFRKMRDALELAGIPCVVTGSSASAVHGVPRTTHDGDIVIAPIAQQQDRLIRHFADPTWKLHSRFVYAPTHV